MVPQTEARYDNRIARHVRQGLYFRGRRVEAQGATAWDARHGLSTESFRGTLFKRPIYSLPHE